MLYYLDGVYSYPGDPNENYGRELLELFSMGIKNPSGQDNYTEQDIKEAARALTGWRVNDTTKQAYFQPIEHDSGNKTIFGQTGAYDLTP